MEGFLVLDDSAPSIAIVEDDDELAQWVQDYLSSNGMRVSIVDRGDLAVDFIREHSPDLVLLDIQLPGKNGHDVCREVREFYTKPILVMTANNEELDEVLGLELGADDFMAKPVRPRVLLARINALLRRSAAASQPESEVLEFGTLSINCQTKTVQLSGENISLSTTEFELLRLLALNAGTVMSRESLVTQLRGIEYDGLDRTIDVRVSRVRKKLGDISAEPKKIKTVWGKGYLFVPNAW